MPKNAVENAVLCAWAEERLPCRFEKYQARGFMVGGKLVAVAVWTNLYPPNIELNFAADSPRWATRGNLRGLFSEAWEKWACTRVTAVVRKKNKRVRRVLEGLGFVLEGTHPRLYEDGAGCSYGLLRENFKYG